MHVGVAVASVCAPGPAFFVEVGAFGRVRAAAGLGVAHVDVETLAVGEDEEVDLVAELVGEGQEGGRAGLICRGNGGGFGGDGSYRTAAGRQRREEVEGLRVSVMVGVGGVIRFGLRFQASSRDSGHKPPESVHVDCTVLLSPFLWYANEARMAVLPCASVHPRD